jgi:hypothetical protein
MPSPLPEIEKWWKGRMLERIKEDGNETRKKERKNDRHKPRKIINMSTHVS